MEQTIFVGMEADCSESIHKMIQEGGSCSIDMRTLKVTWLTHLPQPFLEITMPCGEHRVFKLGELPRKSVRCTCGDPSHWFIKYERSQAQTRFNISPNLKKEERENLWLSKTYHSN